jgi:hypothetical protein
MAEQRSKISRRTFLAAVGAGGAAAAAAVAYKASTPVANPAQKASNKRRGKGYHVTEHIQSYYRTTQV